MILPRTIVFVTCYLDFLKNWIDPLVPFLNSAGFGVAVIHMESLQYEKLAEPVTSSYPIIDLGKKSPREMARLLRELSPAGVVFWNFQSLFELLLMNITSDLGLRTIYVQHGRYNQQTFRYLVRNRWASARRYARLIQSTAGYLLDPRTGSPSKAWALFAATIRGDYRRLRTEYAILYAPGSHRKIDDRFQYPSENVLYSGYPMARLQSELEKTDRPASSDELLYLHQAFLANGKASMTQDEEGDYLRSLAEAAGRYGFRFRIRLHPRVDRGPYEVLAARTEGMELDASPDLLDSVRGASVVLGHNSSSLLAAVVLDKPLLITDFPGISESDTEFESVGIRVTDAENLGETLGHPSRWQEQLSAYDEFRRQNIGTDNSQEHLAMTICRVLSRSNNGETSP